MGQTVIVIHADASRRAELALALSVEFHVLEAASGSAALTLLADAQVDAVVADAASNGLVEAVSRRGAAPIRVVLCRPDEMEALFDSANDSHTPIVMPHDADATAVLARIRDGLRPRKTDRRVLDDGVSVVFQRSGTATVSSHRILDISNRGLAVEVGSEQPLEGLLPGARLEDLRIVRGSDELLRASRAMVRHLGPLPDAQGRARYRAGLRLTAEPVREPESAAETLRDLVPKAAVLRQALRQGGIAIRPVDEPDVALFHGGRIDAGGLLLLQGRPLAGLVAGDVVRGTFDLGGTSYIFISSVAEPPAAPDDPTRDGTWRLRMPRTITAYHRRSCHRYQPHGDRPIAIELRTPFDESVVLRRRLIDINVSGLAFYIDSDREILPVGTAVRGMRVVLPDGAELALRGRVRSLNPMPGSEGRGLKCGIELEGTAAVDRARIADAIVGNGMPGVSGPNGMSFDEVWSFLRSSGFIYPEKEAMLLSTLPEIRSTLSTLLADNGGLAKTLVYRQGARVQGHLSLVRIHSRTWLVQHLSTTRQGSGWLAAARQLNLGLVEFLDQTPEMEWLVTYFRPENTWPARVFGSFAKRVNDPLLSELRPLCYLTGETDGEELAERARELAVRPATAADGALIEHHFVRTGRLLSLRAEDLCRDKLELGPLGRAFSAIGLERRREALIAERAGRPVGFALLPVSSLGLNLSELTNAFTVHTLEPDGEACRLLVDRARARYRELGRSRCVALAEADQVSDFERAGMVRSRVYCQWMWHRSLYRRYFEHVQRLYRRSSTARATVTAIAS